MPTVVEERVTQSKSASPYDADLLLRDLMLWLLTASYVLLTFTAVVAVVTLPLGDPRTLITVPAWLQPMMGTMSLVDAFLVILFGPARGVGLVALLVALLTTPRVHRWLRSRVNELVFGQHDDVHARVAQVNPHLRTLHTPQAIAPAIVASMARSLRLPYVAMVMDGQEVAAGTPPAPSEITTLPLVYQQTTVGELRVGPRQRDEPLSRSDLRVLQELAQQVAIALYAAQMTEEVQRARTALVRAREEERRRIRRDLHDGLGPTLAMMVMQVEQAREGLPAEAAAGAQTLGELTHQLQAAIADVRRLVYDLRPPALDEFGLVGSLREYLGRATPKPLTLHLELPAALPPLPAAVEVAAFRIVQEAVTNVLKHARARTLWVRLAVVDRADAAWCAELVAGRSPQVLQIEVVDDGVGLGEMAAAREGGVGLTSMRERAEELGGVCVVLDQAATDAAQPGVRVAACLPLTGDEEAHGHDSRTAGG